MNSESNQKKVLIFNMLRALFNAQMQERSFTYAHFDKDFEKFFIQNLNDLKKMTCLKSSFSSFNDQDIKEIHDELYDICLSHEMPIESPVIKRQNHIEWLPEEKLNIKWNHWNCYEKFLIKQNFQQSDITKIDKDSDKVIDLLEKPQHAKLTINGLLYGEVQAGKTATYTAVIHKAVDVGWRIIIVLTSNSDDLRRQTQERINSDVIGESNSSDNTEKIIGIGHIRNNYEQRNGKISSYFRAFTSLEEDFSKRQSSQSLIRQEGAVAIFVCKKENTVLNNLKQWFNSYSSYASSLPCLVIDDEADWASINTKKDENPTTINENIRTLLTIFNRSAYLAVTATPYANIFIDPQIGLRDDDKTLGDLFPHDFIVPMIPSSSYYGVEKLFGTNGEYGYNKLNEQIVIPLGKTEDPSSEQFNIDEKPIKKDQTINYLPPSLEKALRYFFCCCVYKDIKELSNSHATMLVHVDRYVNHHKDLENLIEIFLNRERQHASLYQSLPKTELQTDKSFLEYQNIWELGCQRTDAKLPSPTFKQLTGLAWIDVWREFFYPAITEVVVKTINGKSKERGVLRKIYQQPHARLVAIGGDALGRGITLEGLCVSYLSRRTQAADTLLQLGRFFGYRQKVIKYMKIWLSDVICNSFEYAAEITAAFRHRTVQMNHSHKTPDEFGYCLRADPEGIKMRLLITAKNKARHSEIIQIPQNVIGAYQTQKFEENTEIFKHNFQQISEFLQSLPRPKVRSIDTVIKGGADADLVWTNISTDQIIDLLRKFYCYGWSNKMPHSVLIDLLSDDWKDRNWEVRVISVKKDQEKTGLNNLPIAPVDCYNLGSGYEIGLQKRSTLIHRETAHGSCYCSFKNSALMSSRDIARRYHSKSSKDKEMSITDVLDIEHETAPAQLIIYTLKLDKYPEFFENQEPIISGLVIALPTSKLDAPKRSIAKYQANEVFMISLADDE